MTTAEAYREGLAYGRRLADWMDHWAMTHTTGEEALRLELRQYTAPSNRAMRARVLGELRGYRNAQP